MTPNRENQRFFGIDLAKRESHLAVLAADGTKLDDRRFAMTRERLSQIASGLTPDDTVAFEMTTNSFAVARLFRASGAGRVIVSNPMMTKLIAQAKIKTDKIDARVLAELARVGFLPEVWVPDEDTETLRRLMSRRSNLARRRTAMMNDVHSIMHRNLVDYARGDLFAAAGVSLIEAARLPAPERMLVDDYRDEIAAIRVRIERTETAVAAFVASRPHLLRQMDLLLTVDGIGMVVAAGLLAAIGDIGRFRSPKKLASYFGLVPSTYQSGDGRAFHGRITKQGRADARWLLAEAAETLIRTPSPLAALYRRVHAKKGHNVAKTAVARKMAELVWHILTKDQPYLYQKHRLTQEKQARVRFVASGAGAVNASAAVRDGSRSALYGTGIEGRKLKTEASRLAAKRAAGIYEAVVSGKTAPPKEGFNPLRPTQYDYERLIREALAELLRPAVKSGRFHAGNPAAA